MRGPVCSFALPDVVIGLPNYSQFGESNHRLEYVSVSVAPIHQRDDRYCFDCSYLVSNGFCLSHSYPPHFTQQLYVLGNYEEKFIRPILFVESLDQFN